MILMDIQLVRLRLKDIGRAAANLLQRLCKASAISLLELPSRSQSYAKIVQGECNKLA